MGYLPRRGDTWSRTRPRERSVLQPQSWEGRAIYTSPLKSDMELQGLEFALLAWVLLWPTSFPLYVNSSLFGKVIPIL